MREQTVKKTGVYILGGLALLEVLNITVASTMLPTMMVAGITVGLFLIGIPVAAVYYGQTCATIIERQNASDFTYRQYMQSLTRDFDTLGQNLTKTIQNEIQGKNDQLQKEVAKLEEIMKQETDIIGNIVSYSRYSVEQSVDQKLMELQEEQMAQLERIYASIDEMDLRNRKGQAIIGRMVEDSIKQVAKQSATQNTDNVVNLFKTRPYAEANVR